MSGRNNRLLNTDDKEENFWPTFTDLLSVVILVILLVLVAYIILAQANTIRTQQVQESIDEQLKTISGVRSEITEVLDERMDGSSADIEFDRTTGAVSFSGNVLFETDSAVIKPEFEDMLQEYIPEYIGVLLNEKNRDLIGQIIVEGHTDDTGGYFYNLDLSQRRALNVVKYILGDDFPDFQYKDILREYITANGKSESNLIRNEEGRVLREKSRRVEIKFTIKDRYFIERMQEIIDESRQDNP